MKRKSAVWKATNKPSSGRWNTTRQFSELLKAERRVVKDLGIRIKELESMGQTSTDTDVEIEAPIVKPDTLIIHEPIASTFEWEDAWVRVSGEVHPNMIRAKINITDTITIVAHRKARQWLFFRCKGIQSTHKYHGYSLR